MTIPVIAGVVDSISDGTLVQGETEALMTSVFNTAIAGIVLTFGMGMLIKVAGQESPGVKVAEMAEDIAGLRGLASVL